jgi:regulator of replication initiation timing
MEVKKATDFLEDIGYSVSGYGNTYISGDIGVKKGTAMTYFKKLKEISTLLKSLESENKKLKKENKALRKDKWELEGINEACRKENEAYRGMWEALWDVLELCTIYDSKRKGIQTYAEVILPELEQKYLGGGE